jgi:hypothetical protein
VANHLLPIRAVFILNKKPDRDQTRQRQLNIQRRLFFSVSTARLVERIKPCKYAFKLIALMSNILCARLARAGAGLNP